MNIDITKETLLSLSSKLVSGELSSVAICEAYLARAAEVEDKIKAFLVLDKETVLRQAEASDSRRKQGKALSDYDGLPIALKDCIVAEGQICSCASKILENLKSPYDSTAARRLKDKGFVIFGRTNMDEFAMGSSCENSAFFKTANPWDTGRVPGGSSGGSAAAVSALEVPAALGSDTGGSIRQPASFCGIVGLKPTYGRVSRYGLVAFASSLDQIGPMTRTVDDAAVIFDIIGGHDSMDSSSLNEPCSGIASEVLSAGPASVKGLKIALPKEYLEADGLEDSVKDVLHKSADILKGLGAEVVDVSLAHTKYAVATYYIIAPAEASANLARFDGIRYGLRADDADDLMSTYFKTRGRGFGREVKRRILLGTYVLSSGYYDAYYLRAQKVRTLIRKDFDDAFKTCDLIMAPVSPGPAFRFGEKSDPLQMYLADIFTLALNLSGNCGISVPAGIDHGSGMPLGVQFIAPPMEEKILLCGAKAFESARGADSFIPHL